MALKGSASPEVEQTYTRAWQLCQQVGDMPHLPQILMGLVRFYTVKSALERARELGEQLLQLAQRRQERGLLLIAHRQLGSILFFQGELLLARAHFEQGISLYDPHQHHALTLLHNSDPGVFCLNSLSLILWVLGYPSQALRRSHEALTLARQFSHPYTLAHALIYTAMLHKNRREGQLAQEGAEAGTALAREHGFAQ
jgi:predicted ATPase